MTGNLCAHPTQLMNPTISKFCYSSYMVIITFYNLIFAISALLSHSIISNFYQSASQNFWVSNPTVFFFCFFVFLFFLRFLRNYMSIIVNIIGSSTVLQCYLLWIFVSVRRLHQLIVFIGVSTPTPSHLKNIAPSFVKSRLKSAHYPSPPKKKKKKIGFFSELP